MDTMTVTKTTSKTQLAVAVAMLIGAAALAAGTIPSFNQTLTCGGDGQKACPVASAAKPKGCTPPLGLTNGGMCSRCLSGQTYDGNGSCIAALPPCGDIGQKACPAGTPGTVGGCKAPYAYYNVNGTCAACPQGTTYYSGICRVVCGFAGLPACSDGTCIAPALVDPSTSKCVATCPAWERNAGNGKCASCGDLNQGICAPPAQAQCKPGLLIGLSLTCVTKCERGSIYHNGSCTY